ncbi:MAG: DHHW family protein, partial [Oscillospiraceae bacterium]
MKNLLKFPVIIIFTLAIIILTVLDFAKPDIKFSDMENRVLQSNPEFSFESLVAKDSKEKYTTKYEKYINDQFIARNSWISIKSFAETALGKQENNGIIYGEDGYMFERFDTIDEERLNKNIGFVKEYAEKNNLPMTFCIIPNSYMVLKDKFPSGAIAIDQKKYTNQIFEELKSDKLTTEYIGPLEYPNEYVYYRTDHHWTTLGAYYGYEQLMKSKGMTPISFENLAQYSKTVEPFYGTYFSKAKKPNVISDTITYYDIPIKQVTINDEVKDGLYDKEQFK